MGHTWDQLLVHMVYATEHREPLLDRELRPRLHAYLGATLTELGCAPIAINGMADHVHLLFRLSPGLALAEVARRLKAHSSGWIHRTQPALKGFAWQSGYSAFSVSPSLCDKVRAYIANQEQHHRLRSFADECAALLEKNGVARK